MHEVPYVLKKTVTIIVVGDSFEANALRAVLENFNFRVTVHWVGSRKELLMLLDGTISIADELILLSCHGIEKGIEVPGEEPLGPQELGQVAKVPNKTVINLGCKTGSPDFQQAFKQAGAAHYIAPDDYPEGSAAMVFAVNLFYFIKVGRSLQEAVMQASSTDEEAGQFKLVWLLSSHRIHLSQNTLNNPCHRLLCNLNKCFVWISRANIEFTV
jgi:hypothetical protein